MLAKEILNAWLSYLAINSKDEQQTTIANERYLICKSCPNLKISPFFRFVGLVLINDENLAEQCGVCGCPIAVKILAEGNCPINNW